MPLCQVCIGGGSGFIGSHLAIRLKSDGHKVRCVDYKKNEFMREEEFCDEFLQLDLRSLENCEKAVRDCQWVFNLAADMGGMGFISSNQASCLYNNMQISFHMIEASRRENVSRFFYASSACVYPEHLQLDTSRTSLKEDDAWPAAPQDAYGLEKLVTEACCQYYQADFPSLEMRIARFHNIYGPKGTWRGGREKAPAAFCRKALVCGSGLPFEVWGDGSQVRSFCYIDDCVEGIIRLMQSDYNLPLNLGSDEDIALSAMAEMVLSLTEKQKEVEIVYVGGPIGVVGRNSDNTRIREVLNWAPSISLRDGLSRTLEWMTGEIKRAEEEGIDIASYASSKVVEQDPNAIGLHSTD
jgi:GDP-D-mannose 3', 5'-epimerase